MKPRSSNCFLGRAAGLIATTNVHNGHVVCFWRAQSLTLTSGNAFVTHYLLHELAPASAPTSSLLQNIRFLFLTTIQHIHNQPGSGCYRRQFTTNQGRYRKRRGTIGGEKSKCCCTYDRKAKVKTSIAIIRRNRLYVYIKTECSAQGQIFHYKLRHQGYSFSRDE